MFGYNIYRSIEGVGALDILVSLPKFTENYIDSTAENGISYQYGISAFDNAQNESDLSDLLVISPVNSPPAIPSSISIISGWRSNNFMDSNNEWDIDQYILYSGSDADFITDINNQSEIIDHPQNELIIDGLINGQTYYFRISAMDFTELESQASELFIGQPIDLAPEMPIGFGGIGSEDKIDLLWTPNSEWDLQSWQRGFYVNTRYLRSS